MTIKPDDMREEPDDDPGRDRAGVYSNYFHVAFNAFEVVIDFGQFFPGGKEHWHTRVVTGPAYARGLLDVLDASMKQYDEDFGATGGAPDE